MGGGDGEVERGIIAQLDYSLLSMTDLDLQQTDILYGNCVVSLFHIN